MLFYSVTFGTTGKKVKTGVKRMENNRYISAFVVLLDSLGGTFGA